MLLPILQLPLSETYIRTNTQAVLTNAQLISSVLGLFGAFGACANILSQLRKIKTHTDALRTWRKGSTRTLERHATSPAASMNVLQASREIELPNTAKDDSVVSGDSEVVIEIEQKRPPIVKTSSTVRPPRRSSLTLLLDRRQSLPMPNERADTAWVEDLPGDDVIGDSVFDARTNADDVRGTSMTPQLPGAHVEQAST